MAPKDEKQVDKIFAGWLDDLPPLSSKVRMSPFEDNFSVSSLGQNKNFLSMSAVCTVKFICMKESICSCLCYGNVQHKFNHDNVILLGVMIMSDENSRQKRYKIFQHLVDLLPERFHVFPILTACLIRWSESSPVPLLLTC